MDLDAPVSGLGLWAGSVNSPAPSLQTSNKHCYKISQETHLNSVTYDLLPFMVGQRHESFTLLSVNDVMLFQHCQQAIKVMCTRHREEALWSKPGSQATCFCVHK
jgi:hypothetical protein